MNSTHRVACRVCRGLNDPSGEFCWYCGASLRKQGYKSGGVGRAARLMGRGFIWLLSAAVLAGVLVGTYLVVNHYLTTARNRTTVQAQTTPIVPVSSTSTSTVVTSTRTDRVISGADRYATAIAISKIGFPNGAPALVLAPGDQYAEAVCAAPLAAAYGGPVLLMSSDGVAGDLSTEITRLNPSQVFLVGVSSPSRVTRQLRGILQDPTVTSLTGNDSFETAALVAEQIKTKLGSTPKVVIAPSDSFAEAIAVAPLAAAKGWPILFSPQSGDAPATTTDAIKSLGATSALAAGTSTKLANITVDRQIGKDSYETSALIAEYAVTQGLSFAHTAIATGGNFPDGLAAAPLLARDKGILLLSNGDQLPPAVLSVFTANVATIHTLDFIALPGLAKSLGTPGASTTTTTSGIAERPS